MGRGCMDVEDFRDHRRYGRRIDAEREGRRRRRVEDAMDV